jgi:integrase
LIDGTGKEDSQEWEIVPLRVVFTVANRVPMRHRALVLLATFADLRWGELAGLRRENVDLDACEVRVAETLADLDKGGLVPETPKSRAGRRTVTFPIELVTYVRAVKTASGEPGFPGERCLGDVL